MVFEDYKIEGDSITLTKQELEEAKNHYYKVANDLTDNWVKDKEDARYLFYLGKTDLINNILKMWEPLEGL